MPWTDDDLAKLPVHRGVRLRGLETTRLETFVDAAFAFAMTMVVISVSELPSNYGELLTALAGAPAFAASFALIMLFWFGHRNWSRRYGLEDGRTILLSLALIFVVLVYVYPLKLMFSSFFAWVSGGRLPSAFAVNDAREMAGLFVVYGVGYGCLAGILALLNRRALQAAETLRLSALERLRTAEQVTSWSVQSATGWVSAAFAASTSARYGVWAGFVYCSLPVTMTWVAVRYARRAEALGVDDRSG